MGTPIFGRRVVSHVVLFSAAFVLAAATAHAGEAQLGVADVSVGEGAGNLGFNVVRSGDTSSEIVVPYSLTPGTATAGSDYNAPANGVVRIPPGLTQGIVSVPVVNDTQGEGAETLSLHLGSPAAFGSPSGFVGPPAIATGGNSLDNMVVADFDGDGRPDIAIANFGGSISVILHDTGGALLDARNYAVSGHPANLAVADFNGDGKPDLVTTIGSNVIAVLLNDGTGNFLSAASYTLNGMVGSKRIATADFNGDGKPDLAIGRFSSRLAVLLNDGSGGFPTSVDFTLPYGPNGLVDVATGDFDGDGKPDIATAGYFGAGLNSTSTLSVLLNDGNGGFLAPLNRPIAREPTDIVTADFDGDGKLDVAEAAVGVRQVAIYFGTGTGGFDRSGFTGGPSGGIVEALDVADFNGDGKPDLAVRDGLNNSVAALLNDGSGGFPQGGVIGYSALGRIFGVAAGDFSGDGKPDLAASTSNSVLVLNQTSSGGFRSPVAAVPAPESVATADFDGDGKSDTATAGKGGATVVLNDGGGGFLDPVSYSVGSATVSSVSILAADLVGDGKPDLVTTNSNSTLTVARNDGSGHFSIAGSYPVGSGPNCVAVADFDTDGKPDLAVANFTSRNVSVLRNDGNGGFLAAVDYPLGNTVALCLTAADFNGDGKPDLAVATAVNNISNDSFAGSVTLMLNDGSGGFLTPVRYDVGPKPTSVAAADFNGDDKVDLAVAIHGDAVTDGSLVSVLRNDGSGGFLPAVDHHAAIGEPLDVVAADFNGDGRPDLAVTDDANPLVSVLLNNGSGGFAPAVTYADGGDGGSLATADFNGDGKPDLAVASKAGSNLAVLLNDPDATVVLSDGSAIGTIIDDDATAVCAGVAATVEGSSGDDTLTGTAGPDVIAGLGGSDTITGLGGNDRICGGSGDDIIDGGAGSDVINGESGVDTLDGGDDPDVLTGGVGNDALHGGAGNDTLDGSGGADTLNGDTGEDLVSYAKRATAVIASIGDGANDGTAGETDTIQGDVENLRGGAANDTLTGDSAANRLYGEGGGDTLNGAGGADSLKGQAGNDTLNGDAGTDTLYGGENDDALHGGADNDSLTGDSGADTLAGETGTDSADYTTRSVPITASIGAGANDGASGENDDISGDVENLRGGSNDDVLSGDANANRLYGNAGNDTLTGSPGNDLLYGDAGNDTINALDGASFIDGLYCGAGADSTTTDTRDRKAADCE